MEREKIDHAVSEALVENEAFLVDLELSEGNTIALFVDADGGIKINQLKMISRQIEAALDRETEDFALTVSSPGLDRPLRVHRQYVNNIGRWLKIKTANGTIKGQLKEVTEDNITVVQPAKKKKETDLIETVSFDEIVETKIQVRF